MIGRLRGQLIERRDNLVLIDCGGVGYEATVSAFTLGSLPADGEDVTLWAYTQTSENRIALYGFGSTRERELFYLLITVKNVGPSSALGILSAGAGPADIAQLIVGEDTNALRKLKGVGKKTAEMLVVELRDKCELLLATWGAVSGGERTTSQRTTAAATGILADVESALLQLGFKLPEVRRVMPELEADAGEASGPELEALIRRGLRLLQR